MRVLVTGSSRGIGRAIYDKFAKEGHEVLNPSRDELDLSKNIFPDFGEIDILINNAGINIPESILDLSKVEEIMNVNFYAPLKLMQAYLPFMKKQSFGRIVNIGSIWVDFSKENRVSYSASKNALHSLTKSIVSEFSQYNILANTVSPGYISTDMTFQNNTEEQLSQIIKNIPLDRLGYPSEVADLVYFLTVNNSYISGQNIVIDGGYSCTAK
jgi:3-oxoacyl-[acyl-carrier protein] reductase